MYIDYLQTFTLVAAACSCSRTRAGLSLSSLVHWRHKWKEKRETVYNLWKDSHLRPQKTTQTHSRHDNTTTSQISRTNLQTTPATWLMQHPQRQHSWDWQHHFGVETEGDRDEDREYSNTLNRNTFGGDREAKKCLPGGRSSRQVEGQALDLRACYGRRVIVICPSATEVNSTLTSTQSETESADESTAPRAGNSSPANGFWNQSGAAISRREKISLPSPYKDCF